MIELRYSEPNELELSGTVDELNLFREKIFDFSGSEEFNLFLQVHTNFDPFPYTTALTGIEFKKHRNEPTRITLTDDDRLLIEGSSANLDCFASFLKFNSDSKHGRHSHFEYFKGNEHIAADSLPLVVAVIGPND